MTPPLPAAPLPTAPGRPVGAAQGGPDVAVAAALVSLRALPDPARAPDPAAALVEDARAIAGVHDALRARLDATAS